MKLGSPSIRHSLRHILGRAVRETGQAMDRAGILLKSWALTEREFGDDPVIYEDHLKRHRNTMPLLNRGEPVLHDQVAYIAPCSTLIGSVRVHKDASIWYGAILRGDAIQNGKSWQYTKEENLYAIPDIVTFNKIELAQAPQKDWAELGGIIVIGEGTNVQDGCLIDSTVGHTIIGKGVTIGHLAHIHSACVGDYSLIGMGSIINPGVVVESEAFVAAGAVIPRDTVVRSGELWVGNPAKKLRDLTEEERTKLHYQSEEYIKVAQGQRGVMKLGGNLSSLYNITTEDLLEVGAEKSAQTGDSNNASILQPDTKSNNPSPSS